MNLFLSTPNYLALYEALEIKIRICNLTADLRGIRQQKLGKETDQRHLRL